MGMQLVAQEFKLDRKVVPTRYKSQYFFGKSVTMEKNTAIIGTAVNNQLGIQFLMYLLTIGDGYK